MPRTRLFDESERRRSARVTRMPLTQDQSNLIDAAMQTRGSVRARRCPDRSSRCSERCESCKIAHRPPYSTRRRSPFTGITPGRGPEGHSPDQEPEVPVEHVPAEGVLVDGPGRGDHIGEDESTGEDRRPAVQDEDQAPDDTRQQEQSCPMRAPHGRTRANASSPLATLTRTTPIPNARAAVERSRARRSNVPPSASSSVVPAQRPAQAHRCQAKANLAAA
jgi:hypothetical protein